MISDIGPIETGFDKTQVNMEICSVKTDNFAIQEPNIDRILAVTSHQKQREEMIRKRQIETEKRRRARAEAEKAKIKEPFGNGWKIHEREMAIVAGIINYMDRKSTIALGWPSNQKFLIDEGAKIDHIHPLCFIWTVLSDPKLKAKLKSFRDESVFSLKWNGFLGYSPFHDKGFGRNMEKYYNHRKPIDYMPELEVFYKVLNLRSEVLNHYAVKKDWKGFASALVDNRSYK